jgi:hypothetical protein
MTQTRIIPGNRLLPQPSILEKLAAYDAQAPETIIERAMELGEQRRATERAALAARRFGLKDIFKGMAELFAPRPAPRRAGPEASVLALNWAWASTGDDLRSAITEYMQDKGLDEDKLDLSAGERESLVKLNAPLPRL